MFEKAAHFHITYDVYITFPRVGEGGVAAVDERMKAMLYIIRRYTYTFNSSVL